MGKSERSIRERIKLDQMVAPVFTSIVTMTGGDSEFQEGIEESAFSLRRRLGPEASIFK